MKPQELGSFTSHKNQINEIAVKQDLLFFKEKKERKSNHLQLSLQRQSLTLNVDLGGV